MARSSEARRRRHAKRMAKRRAFKAAKQAEYQARIAAGKNKKSKRAKLGSKGSNKLVVPERELMMVTCRVNGKVTKALRRVHGGPECRNIGCKRCSPLWN